MKTKINGFNFDEPSLFDRTCVLCRSCEGALPKHCEGINAAAELTARTCQL